MHIVRRVLIALMLFTGVAPAAAQEKLDWSKWYAGAGLGLGINAHYKQDGRTLDFDQGMPGATEKSALGAFNLNGGIALDAKTLFGFSGSGVGKSGKINGNDARTQINNYFAMLTYF